MPTKPPLKMLFIGEPLKEYVATRDPDSGTLSNQQFTGFAGDMAPNMASYAVMAAKHFDIPCRIDVLTALGPEGEEFSDRALKDLKARGLHLHPQSLRIPQKEMGTVINLKTPEGKPYEEEKVRLFRDKSAFRDLLNDADDTQLKAMVKDGEGKPYTHIVVSGIPLGCVHEREKLVKLIQYAKENVPPSKIIISTNLRPSNWKMKDSEHPQGTASDEEWKRKARHWLDQVIPLADTLFANYTDERNLRGGNWSQEVTQDLRKMNAHAEIILTNDEKPIQLLYRKGKKDIATHVPIHPAKQVVDTVGAGDSLAATYLMARQAGYAPKQAVQLGTHVASQVVGIIGALPRTGQEPFFHLQGIRPPGAAATRTH